MMATDRGANRVSRPDPAGKRKVGGEWSVMGLTKRTPILRLAQSIGLGSVTGRKQHVHAGENRGG
jgi:hypothetical protein